MSVLKGAIPCLLLSTIVVAQTPERTFPPSVATRAVIETKLAELTRQIDTLSVRKTDPALVADVAIYQKAAQFILRYPEEFFTAAYVPETIRALIVHSAEWTAAMRAVYLPAQGYPASPTT